MARKLLTWRKSILFNVLFNLIASIFLSLNHQSLGINKAWLFVLFIRLYFFQGMVHNYGDANQLSACPMPLQFLRESLCEPDSRWNFTSDVNWNPQAIIVMLGQNDFSTQPTPTDDQFVNGYVSFLRDLTSKYFTKGVNSLSFTFIANGTAPKPRLIAAITNLCNGNCVENVKKAASITGADFILVKIDSGKGCSSHPNVEQQQQIGTQMASMDFVFIFVLNMR